MGQGDRQVGVGRIIHDIFSQLFDQSFLFLDLRSSFLLLDKQRVVSVLYHMFSAVQVGSIL